MQRCGKQRKTRPGWIELEASVRHTPAVCSLKAASISRGSGCAGLQPSPPTTCIAPNLLCSACVRLGMGLGSGLGLGLGLELRSALRLGFGFGLGLGLGFGFGFG